MGKKTTFVAIIHQGNSSDVMSSNKIILEQSSLFDDVMIIGITSSMIDYKISIAFDRAAQMTFRRLPDITDEDGAPYSFYFYKYANGSTSFNLISLNNRLIGKSWLGRLPMMIDYILLIRGNDANEHTTTKILSSLASYPNINAYIIKDEGRMQKVYSKIANLILEQAELHELVNDKSDETKQLDLKYHKFRKAV